MKKIDNIPKKNSFKAPDDYFDSFESRLQQRLETRKQKQNLPVWQAVKPYFYMLAFFAGMAFLLKVGINHFSEDFQNQFPNTEIAENQSLYYEYEFISEEMIYDELISDPASAITENELDEEAMVTYLADYEIEYLLYE
ncbi:MAG: hypothetical protein R6V52_06310 [Bacteroidales bacterium]